MKHIAALIVALSASACTPYFPILVVNMSSGEPKPASEVMSESDVKPRDGAGAILITRPIAWLGMRCTYDVALDDKLVAGLRNGEQLAIYTDPGERVLGISVRDKGGCKPASTQIPLKVVAYATNRVRIESDIRYDLKVVVNTFGGSLPTR